MASTYVNDLRLNEMATGDGSGTWGTTTNTNLELIGEAISYATQESFSSDANATTTVADGAADPARAFYFKVTSSGSLTATRVLTIAPNTMSRIQIIENATSGSQIITIKQGTGATVNIPTGESRMVYYDGAGAGAAVADALADINIGGKVTVGVNDTGHDVKFFGATSGKYWLWDESADGVLQYSTLTVGVDDTGYDVKFFGATSGKYILWDESDDALIIPDSTNIKIGTGNDLQLFHDGTDSYIKNATGALKLATETSGIVVTIGHTTSETTVADNLTVTGNVTVGVDDTGGDVKFFGATSGKYWLWDESADGVVQYSALTVGVDDTGYDVKFFGATSGAYMLWDESADDLKLVGAAGFTVAGDIDVDGTANLDNTDIDGTFAVDGTTISLDATTSLNIDNSNTSNGITIATATSGVPISIGHSTSETTVNDNLTVTGQTTLSDNILVGNTKKLGMDGTVNNYIVGTSAADKIEIVTNTSSVRALFNASGITGVINDTSDGSLKENVADITNATATVKALKGRTFDWIEDSVSDAGFIAQEVATVLPNAVVGETGQLAVRVDNIVAHLVTCIQELEARIAALES